MSSSSSSSSLSWKKPFEQGVVAFKEKRLFRLEIEYGVCMGGSRAFKSTIRTRMCLIPGQLLTSSSSGSGKPWPIRESVLVFSRNDTKTARIFLTIGKHDRAVQMVEAARKRLNASDAGYQKRIEELAKVEQSAREAEARRRAHVDPLRKLPLELLDDICRLVVRDMDLEHPRGAAHFAITLGSVCKSLREMVYSVPWFWQSLSISGNQFGKKSAFWLERLDGQGLYSLSLVDIPPNMAPKLWKFIEATRPESWKHLTIIGMDAFGYTALDVIRNHNVQLHSLSFRPGLLPVHSTHPNVETCDPDKIISLFSPRSDPLGTRKLALHLAQSHRPPRKRVRQQPTSQFAPLPDFKDIPVLRLENLEELRIATIGPLHSLTTLVFPKLQILDLQQLSAVKPAILLRYLTDCDPSDRPPLRELRLSRVAMHSPLLLSLLNTFHETLEFLEVSYCSAFPPDLFSTLSFPNLRDVNFSGADELRASHLVKMVKNGKGMIRNIVVDACPCVDPEALPWLRANAIAFGAEVEEMMDDTDDRDSGLAKRFKLHMHPSEMREKYSIKLDLRFVTEAEASVHYCISHSNISNRLKAGLNFAVCDAGGSTVDITVYTVTSMSPLLKLAEKRDSACIQAGGLYVDDAVEKYLEDTLTRAGIDPEDIKEYVEEGVKDFEKFPKRLFSDGSDSLKLKLGDKGLTNRNQRSPRRYDTIIKSVDDQIRGINVSHILLVGGFGDSPYLQQQLKERLALILYKSSQTDTANRSKAVAEGAIMWNTMTSVFSRAPNWSYGIQGYVRFDSYSSDHRERTTFTTPDGYQKVTGVWCEIVKKNAIEDQKVEVNRLKSELEICGIEGRQSRTRTGNHKLRVELQSNEDRLKLEIHEKEEISKLSSERNSEIEEIRDQLRVKDEDLAKLKADNERRSGHIRRRCTCTGKGKDNRTQASVNGLRTVSSPKNMKWTV
ncbi:TPR-1 domain-containing protein [Rhizoctonia solani]|uniref:TPR-1 domain-containing protein n=1 Tax=Rhizoctonia solani TaxID=456999 RepID=A0A8H8NVV7_9AGAM|nr:TPR-1 domain-containing protein [Rhizoctonia solani]QRW20330.1 TPR-1 domain-containing protein [Rhizoctonia solani]